MTTWFYAVYGCLSWGSYKFKGFDVNTEGRKWKNDFLSKTYSSRIQPYVNIVTAQESLFQKGFLIIGLDYSEEQHFTLHCICKFTECIVHWGIYHFVPHLQNLREPTPSTPYTGSCYSFCPVCSFCKTSFSYAPLCSCEGKFALFSLTWNFIFQLLLMRWTD